MSKTKSVWDFVVIHSAHEQGDCCEQDQDQQDQHRQESGDGNRGSSIVASRGEADDDTITLDRVD